MNVNSLFDQTKISAFIPDEKIFFGVGVSNYDAVWKISKDQKDKYQAAQTFPDIPNAYKDVENMYNLLQAYDFDLRPNTKGGKEDLNQTLFMFDNAPEKDVFSKGFMRLSKLVREGKKHKPPKKYLLMFLFAGHGMIVENS